MTNTLRIIQHTPQEIAEYAKTVGITLDQAQLTDKKREWHILWEYDYIKQPKLV